MIVGADWGNYQTTIVTENQIDTYPSTILYNRDLKLTNHLRRYDFVFEYRGLTGIAGTLAQDEKNELDRNRRGDSKMHTEALIRLLVGLHQFTGENVNVVVGQPISSHKSEKDKIRAMLEGTHTITVNGVTKDIHIEEARVSVEGACALLKMPGLNHIVDIGSGTINFATVKNGRFISSQSDTIPKGIENLNHDYEAIARNIENVMIDLSWKKKPFLSGGGAHLIDLDFPVLHPTFRNTIQPPETATAIGLYEIGEMIWSTSVHS